MHDDDLPDVPTCETDDRFPSGTWLGYFIQWNSRSRTELDLFFKDGLISGAGADWVGEFIVKGRYQIDDGKCWWTKRYLKGHDVAYQGYAEGKGIWGLWEIPQIAGRGGFHIWPKGTPEGDAVEAEEAEPVTTVVFETV